MKRRQKPPEMWSPKKLADFSRKVYEGYLPEPIDKHETNSPITDVLHNLAMKKATTFGNGEAELFAPTSINLVDMSGMNGEFGGARRHYTQMLLPSTLVVVARQNLASKTRTGLKSELPIISNHLAEILSEVQIASRNADWNPSWGDPKLLRNLIHDPGDEGLNRLVVPDNTTSRTFIRDNGPVFVADEFNAWSIDLLRPDGTFVAFTTDGIEIELSEEEDVSALYKPGYKFVEFADV